jgi:small-conductance mechanosensitive channel
MKKQDQSSAPIFAFRVIAVVLGLIAFVLGWTAQSEGILWHTGRSTRLGVETTTPTLSWMIYGVLLILAGIIPWKWLSGRLKR